MLNQTPKRMRQPVQRECSTLSNERSISANPTDVQTVLKENRSSFMIHWLINFVAGLICFVLLYTNQLVNHYDGIWAFSSFQTGAWEISLGRWLWPVLDIIRGNYAGDPFNSILSLAVIALSNTFAISLFSSKINRRAALYSAIVMASTSVCVMLSYRFTSPTFAFGYLFAVLGVFVLNRIKQPWAGIPISAAFLIASLAMYQSMIGCSCLLIVVLGMWQCVKCSRIRFNHVRYLVVSGFTVLLSLLVYTVLWQWIMHAQGISAVDYKGADSISIAALLRNLPNTMMQAYSEFVRFFFGNSLRHSLFQGTFLYTAMFSVLVLGLLFCAVLSFRKRIVNGVMLLIYAAVIPIACNFSLLLAPGNSLEMQMTLPLSLLIPLLLLFIDLTVSHSDECKNAIRYAIPSVICAAVLFLHGNVNQVAYDLTAMQEGLTATETLISNVVTSAVQNNMYDENENWVFIGIPCENPMFQKSSLWKNANEYARFGQWWEGVNGQRSYRGILRRLGIQWPMLPNDDYDAFIQSNDELIRNMPLYPYEGSMQRIDGVTVVKISNSPYAPGVEKMIESYHPPILNIWYDLAFADTPSTLHVTTREDIRHLELYINDCQMGHWQEEDVEIIEYVPQHCKEWVVPYTFEDAGTYNLCFRTSYDGIRFFSYQDMPDTSVEIFLAPIAAVEYELGCANSPSTIIITVSEGTEYLTLNLGDTELGSWTAADVTMAESDLHGYNKWLLQYTFQDEGVYDLWYRSSADGISYVSFSAGAEGFIEILGTSNE